jgi:hypothetical protein
MVPFEGFEDGLTGRLASLMQRGRLGRGGLFSNGSAAMGCRGWGSPVAPIKRKSALGDYPLFLGIGGRLARLSRPSHPLPSRQISPTIYFGEIGEPRPAYIRPKARSCAASLPLLRRNLSYSSLSWPQLSTNR